MWRDSKLLASDVTLPEYDMIVAFIAGMNAYEESSKTAHGSRSQASVVFEGEVPGLKAAMEADAMSLGDMFA